MTEKMDIRKPGLPSDVGWDDIEVSDNKTQNLISWNERNGRDLDKPTRKRKGGQRYSGMTGVRRKPAGVSRAEPEAEG
jgi:hypothetical protein